MRKRQRWLADECRDKLEWCFAHATVGDKPRYRTAIMWIKAAVQGAGIL